MLIRDLFQKKINREIKGVIKVGQGEDENKKQELEEYVVTKDLQEKFKDFYEAYYKSLHEPTDNMGVWISGFFGSGKSHFLKILSYLLDNEEVDGKKAIDYFKEDNKMKDTAVLAKMEEAAKASADVILFNIDAESSSKDSHLVDIFLQVFNKMRGYHGSNPHVAELEATLEADGKYEAFQKAYEQHASEGRTWFEERNQFKYRGNRVKQTLIDIGYMDEVGAENFLASTNTPYEMNPIQFAELVQSYIKKRGNNHRVIFLVDEISQYIGNNSNLMLNLQTIVEQLGVHSSGKAWVIVTGQEAIDEIAAKENFNSNDFSKIQGRFHTRIALNSHDVQEVIKKRILEKNDQAKAILTELYDANESFIRNLILFSQSSEVKLYENAEDFQAVYPFVPYQFDLLGRVLTSIRENSSSGKHLSEGERSLLAAFQESALAYIDKEEGALVPFSSFYEPLERFLDHAHSSVIAKALRNNHINPNDEKNPLPIRVLKVLFMIKYVDKGIKATAENIASLMVEHTKQDRLNLEKEVKAALDVLHEEEFIERNLDVYKFLTNEEQDMNREIRKTVIEFAELRNGLWTLLYQDILADNGIKGRYRYPKFHGRYTIPYNLLADDTSPNVTAHGMSLNILTAQADRAKDESTLRMETQTGNVLIVSLPEQKDYVDELRLSMQIARYLQVNPTSGNLKEEEIRIRKQSELGEHRANAKRLLEEALKEADFYFHGAKLEINKKDLGTRITEALERMVNQVYSKLTYIEEAFKTEDIRGIFTEKSTPTLDLEDVQVANHLAVREVEEYIKLIGKDTRINLKHLKEAFAKAPYGYISEDVAWIVGTLLKNGKIDLYFNQEKQSAVVTPVKDLEDYLLNQRKAEKVQLAEKEVIPEKWKRAVVRVGKDLLRFISDVREDDEALMSKFKEKVQAYLGDISNYGREQSDPGREILQEVRTLLKQAMESRDSMSFYQFVFNHEADFEDSVDALEDVINYYRNEAQQDIWRKALQHRKLYQNGENFINDEALKRLAHDMAKIQSLSNPYRQIGSELRQLNNEFIDLYTKKLEEQSAYVEEEINVQRERVMEELNTKAYRDEFVSEFKSAFDDLVERARHSGDFRVLQSMPREAEVVAEQKFKKMWEKDAETATPVTPLVEGESGDQVRVNPPQPPKPKIKYVFYNELKSPRTWDLKTASDVEKRIEALRQELLAELEENKIVKVQF